MCGFAGIISNNAVRYNNIHKMSESITHRGPDSSSIIGLCKNSNEFLTIDSDCNCEMNCVSSFRRLSIRDLSPNGCQPMLGNHTLISFVGEIYNADTMRNKLMKRGIVFLGKSDTEVLLKWYEFFGVESLIQTISGIYAIVIIDNLNRIAYLIRDKFGVKPLYYYLDDNVLVYSSEIKSICCSDYYKTALNDEALGEVLLYRSPGFSLMYKDINHVVPGAMILFDLDKGILFKKTWFDVNQYRRIKPAEISEDEAYCLLEDELKYAVKRQLISDVPLGIQLSGGIDSGIIANIARTYSGLKSYSVIGGKGYYSEEDRIRRVNHVNTDLMKLYEFTVDDFLINYEKVIWHLDGINNHPNALGFYKLTQNAKQEVSVLLSGEGADELLGGYRQFVLGKTIFESFDSFVALADQDVDLGLIKSIFPDVDFEFCVNQRKFIFNGFTGDNLDKHIKYELTTYLPDLLIKQDRMAMSNSIENRVPFLDYEFVDKMMIIPNEYLVRFAQETNQYEGKYLLKRLASNIYDVNYGFQKKKGFPMPIADWISQKKFREYVLEYIIPGMKKRKLVNVNVFEEKYGKIEKLTDKEIKALWKTINFETWAQIFLDERAIIDINR